jgi:ABC-2 type transport system ATP-binding protein
MAAVGCAAVTTAQALEAVGVSKRYGRRDALCEVDLVAERGRVHGLLGPNGAGKTTLLRILLGLVHRDAGSVRLLGRPLEARGGSIPIDVAGIVETPAFYPYLSGRQNLAALAALDRDGSSSPRCSVDGALEQVGLAADAHHRVCGYSAGMRQRLAVAAALLRAPQLLFLDEPTNALDPRGVRDIRALARRLANDGVAVVLSSHDLAEVEELCGTVTIIDAGRVLFSGAVDHVRRRVHASLHVLRTSDDEWACRVASTHAGVKVTAVGDGGLEVLADLAALDAFVIALGCGGIAVRALEHRVRPLESLFLELTRAIPPIEATVTSMSGARNNQTLRAMS